MYSIVRKSFVNNICTTLHSDTCEALLVAILVRLRRGHFLCDRYSIRTRCTCHDSLILKSEASGTVLLLITTRGLGLWPASTSLTLQNTREWTKEMYSIVRKSFVNNSGTTSHSDTCEALLVASLVRFQRWHFLSDRYSISRLFYQYSLNRKSSVWNNFVLDHDPLSRWSLAR